MKYMFEKISKEWLDLHRSKIKLNSIAMYQSKVNIINNYFEGNYINDITYRDIQKFLNTLSSEKLLTNSTIKKYKYTLNQIFEYAIIEKIIKNNPVIYTSLPYTISKNKRRSLTKQEISKIINSVDLPFGLYIYTLLFTGTRRSECLALRWEDIDFEKNIIVINKSVMFVKAKPIVDYKLKNGDNERYVPLLSNLKTELLKRKKGLNGWIFCDDKGNLLTESSVEKLWRTYKSLTNIDFTQHYLRHTYATMIYNANIDIKTAQSFLGHKTLLMTLEIYTHLDNKKLVENGEKLNKYITSQINNKRF